MSLLSDANAQQFYVNVLSNHAGYVKNTLIDKVLSICNKQKIDFMSYVFNDNYRNTYKKNLQYQPVDGQNGLIDSIRFILNNYTSVNRNILSIDLLISAL